MIAIDTSSLIAYLSGDNGLDVEATGVALEHRQAVLPPVVLSEILSDPRLRSDVKDLLVAMLMLGLLDGYSSARDCCGRRPSRGGGKRRSPMFSSRNVASIMTWSSSRAIGTSSRWPT